MNNNCTNLHGWKLNLIASVTLTMLLGILLLMPLAAFDGEPLPASSPIPPAPAPAHLPIIQSSAQWSPVGNIPSGTSISLFYEVAVCGQYGLAGTNIGLYSINNITQQQATWQREIDLGGISDQVVSGVTFVPDTNCSTAYATSRTRGVWRGTRTGDNWQWRRVDKGLDEAFVVLVSDNTLFVGGNFGVRWASPLPTDDKTTWNTTDIITTTYGLSISQKDADDIHAAVWQRGVVEKSSDNSSWVSIGTIPNPNVYDAAANASGVVVAGTDSGLMRFVNSSWSASQPPFVLTSFAVLAVGERFYAAHDGFGVVYSRNGGTTWESMGTGLPQNEPSFRVRGLSLSDNGRLFAATRTGVWMWTGQP